MPTSSRTSFIKFALACVLLTAQLFSVVYARTTAKRYFCWAPNDYVTDYRLKVSVHGRELEQQEVLRRYGLKPFQARVYENPAEHLIDFISQYETTYGRHDDAQVELTWTLNGHGPERNWRWPAQRPQE